MPSIPRARVFDVDGSSPEPLRRWEVHNAAALIGLSCTPADAGSFRAREVNLQLDAVHLAFVRGTAHEVVRNGTAIDEHPAGALAVYVPLRRPGWVEVDGTRRIVRPGELLICDADRPFSRGFGDGVEELAAKVSRAAFTRLTGREELARPVVRATGQGADPVARGLVRLVAGALRRVDPVPVDENAVLDMVSVLATDGAVTPSVVHRASAHAYIEEHLDDPRMSAASVAEGVGVSLRTLSRLFAEAGTSIPRHILGRRLDLAYSLLVHRSELRTVEVAATAGFTSPAHFSQSFQRRFGIAAGAVRRDGVAVGE